MLDKRQAYGWGESSVGILSADKTQKWQVFYRCHDGGFGETSYLHNTYDEAVAYGDRYKAEHSWVKEIIIRHPSRCYSAF